MSDLTAPPTKPQLAILRSMAERGVSIVGVLGADVRHPNQRIFFTSDGDTINPKAPGHGYMTVNGLETRGLVKVISTSGEDPPRLKHLVITQKGRATVEKHAPARSVLNAAG